MVEVGWRGRVRGSLKSRLRRKMGLVWGPTINRDGGVQVLGLGGDLGADSTSSPHQIIKGIIRSLSPFTQHQFDGKMRIYLSLSLSDSDDSRSTARAQAWS